jgi:signal transduction histidine kinase
MHPAGKITNKETGGPVYDNPEPRFEKFMLEISNEMKGPLSNILGITYLADGSIKDTDTALQYIDIVKVEVTRLHLILQNLTDTMKLRLDRQAIVEQ